MRHMIQPHTHVEVSTFIFPFIYIYIYIYIYYANQLPLTKLHQTCRNHKPGNINDLPK